MKNSFVGYAIGAVAICLFSNNSCNIKQKHEVLFMTAKLNCESYNDTWGSNTISLLINIVDTHGKVINYEYCDGAEGTYTNLTPLYTPKGYTFVGIKVNGQMLSKQEVENFQIPEVLGADNETIDYIVKPIKKIVPAVKPHTNAKPDTKPDIKAHKNVKPDAKPDIKANTNAKPDTTPDVKPHKNVKPDTTPDVKPHKNVKPDAKPDVKSDTNMKPDIKNDVKDSTSNPVGDIPNTGIDNKENIITNNDEKPGENTPIIKNTGNLMKRNSEVEDKTNDSYSIPKKLVSTSNIIGETYHLNNSENHNINKRSNKGKFNFSDPSVNMANINDSSNDGSMHLQKEQQDELQRKKDRLKKEGLLVTTALICMISALTLAIKPKK